MANKRPDVNLLREFACSKLSSALNSLPGPKDLIIESELIRPLDRIGGINILKENGVGKIFKFDENVPNIVGDRRVFIVRAEVSKALLVANRINADIQSKEKCRFAVLMVPRKLHVCERVFEQQGVHGYLTIESLDLGLIPLDTDILSLEMPTFFKSYFLGKDLTGIHTIASSLVDVQVHFGLIPNMYGLGKASQMSIKMMEILLEEHKVTKSSLRSEIGHLFVFDRDVDYAAVLLSQLTYEGLLDEVFGIKSGFVDLGSQVTGSDKMVSLLLTSDSSIFNEIRDNHVTRVFQSLAEMSKKMQLEQDKRQNMSIDEMSNFVATELKSVQQQHQTLALHIKACEVIKDKKSGELQSQLKTEHSLLKGADDHENINYIEETIIRQYPLLQSLRLLCLLSYTHNGVSSKLYKSLKTQFLHSYGYEHLISFLNLKKLGLFVEHESVLATTSGKLSEKMAAAMAALPRQSSFQITAKKLNLFPKSDYDYSLRYPTDMGYVFSGAYVPLACSFVQQVLHRGGFAGLEEVLKSIPTINFSQVRPKSARGKGGDGPIAQVANATDKTILIYFVGGVTYAEIAALRFLGRVKGYKIIIAATSVINGNTLLDGIVEQAMKIRETPPME